MAAKHPCPRLEGVHKANHETVIVGWVREASIETKYPPKMFRDLEDDFAEFICNTVCEVDTRWSISQVTDSAFYKRLNSLHKDNYKIEFFD